MTCSPVRTAGRGGESVVLALDTKRKNWATNILSRFETLWHHEH